MDDIVNSYLPLFPINSDLENISKKSFLFQFLFFLTNIYMKVANSTEIDFNPEVGFKYSNYSKYYNDMQNKELVLNDYNFLHKGEAQRNRWKVNLNFSYTKILKFTHSDSTRFYCVFFEYGSSGYDKEFEDYAKWLIGKYLLEIIKENVPIIFMGHSQGSATVLSVLNEICKIEETINFKNLYGITLGLGRINSLIADLFTMNYNKFGFNYIDIMNFASTNIDAYGMNKIEKSSRFFLRHMTMGRRYDNYPYLSDYNEYNIGIQNIKFEKRDIPTRCMDSFINSITIYNSSCDPNAYSNPYFCRNISKGSTGHPVKNPWYNNIPPEFRKGINDPENTQIQNWIENQRQHPIYSKYIDYILKLNKECSTRPTPSPAGLVPGPLIENKRNWGYYNSEKFNKCEELFTMYHKHINVNTYGFLIDMNGELTLSRIDKENIVKNLLLDDMKNTGKIYYIRTYNDPNTNVYILNEKNKKIICQSRIGPFGNAHEAKTYRNLFIEYAQEKEDLQSKPLIGGYIIRPIFY